MLGAVALETFCHGHTKTTVGGVPPGSLPGLGYSLE